MRSALLPILALAAVAPAVAAAQQQARDARAEVAQLQAEYRDEVVRARQLRLQADEATQEIERLRTALAGFRSGQDDAETARQRARLREIGLREAALIAELSRTRAPEGRLLSALQMLSRDPPPPLLVPADKAVDTVRAAILMKAMQPALQARAQGIIDRQGELEKLRRHAALGSERLFTADSDRGDHRAELESAIARQTNLKAVLIAEAALAERSARALEARLKDLGAAAPAPETESEPAVADNPAGRRRLTPPVEGTPSARFSADAQGWRWRGDGLAVKSPADARVDYVGELSGWGRVVILDLGPGWRGVVAGLDETSVEIGQRVTDGQSLGSTGQGGEAYFELRRDQRPVDPGPWLQ